MKKYVYGSVLGHGMYEYNIKSIELHPISELLTAMLQYYNEEGKYYFNDAAFDNCDVFHALCLTDDGFEGFAYVADTMDYYDGKLCCNSAVRLVPTMHCLKCGRRMFAGTTIDNPDHVIYRCVCGETLDEDIIQKIDFSLNNKEV